MNTVYIGLGSNLGQSIDCLKQALDSLDAHPQIEVLSISRFYRSRPMGPADQPDYINAAVKIESLLSVESILAACQMLEILLGRVRKVERWGPRTLDLDILLADDFCSNSAYLTVPHYGMLSRSFVLLPLADILSPETMLPQGLTLRQAIEQLTLDDIEAIQ
jgi:2-amino-4-hydroxy-6-hydroxymethyldihydropteridine diphosphokinase